ncbi:MAG: efflux RND transporter periplasmic adaptor subunit [Bacillota bacterium]|nr:efflux RND transporter periplasmic adaptor subunit [Bacillota bacterium]
MKKKYIVWILIVVLLGGGYYAVRRGRKDRNIITVKTSAAQVGEIKSYLSTTATIQSKNSKDYFGQQAKVKKVNVKVGDSVKAGTVMVEYEAQDLDTAVKQAQLQYDNAALSRNDLYNQNDSINSKIADLDKQINDLSSNPKPDATAATTLSTLKSQRAALSPISNEKLKQADNAVSLAKLTLDSAKQKQSSNITTITADFDGVVTALNVVEGQMGNAAQPAVTVQDTSNLKAVLSLGKFDAAKVKVGQDVVITSGSSTYKGKVSFLDPAAGKAMSASGGDTTLGAEIDILDKAADLKINFDVDVDILVGQAENVLMVPAESVKSTKDNKSYVYVLEGNVVHEKNISTSIQSDTEVGVSDGIKSGEKVILNPSTSIQDGVKVKDAAEVK